MIVGGPSGRLLAYRCGPRATTCESCHWPSTEHHDSVAVKKRYATDAKSSE